MHIKSLLRFLSGRTVYQTVPMYNLNWVRSKSCPENIWVIVSSSLLMLGLEDRLEEVIRYVIAAED